MFVFGCCFGVNIVNEFGDSALHIAVSKDCDIIVRLLLRAGADISLVNEDGYTPEALARYSGYHDLIPEFEFQPRIKSLAIESRCRMGRGVADLEQIADRDGRATPLRFGDGAGSQRRSKTKEAKRTAENEETLSKKDDSGNVSRC